MINITKRLFSSIKVIQQIETKVYIMSKTIKLNNNLAIPQLGYGTYMRKDTYEDVGGVKQAVLKALEIGYRHIDCASFYKNEKEVGQAIKESGIPRNELFITGKVWNDFQGLERAKVSFLKSMEDLDIDYFDLFLVHWPLPGYHCETYKCLEQLQKDGKVKSIGLSNYTIDDYEELEKSGISVKPVCNQVEVNPGLYRKKTIDYFMEKDIIIAAYKPLRAGKILKNQTVIDMASKYNISPARLSILWGLQHDMIVIPKSSNPKNMLDNFVSSSSSNDDDINSGDVTISKEDMATLDALTTDDDKKAWYEHYLSRRGQDPPPKGEKRKSMEE